jgi:5'-3' exonuclease
MMQIGNSKTAEVEENMLRHMILNSIRSYKLKYTEEYGKNFVIACDNTNIWRKQIFPYYKANRKKNRDSSILDWSSIFESLNKIRQELKDFFPYTVIDIQTAEADDIIACICKKYSEEEKILILSGDKDFIQLHKFKNVSQYDPVRKKTISHPNPEKYLQEHIIRGDSGDGVPNFLSSDNCLVIGERQKSVTEKKLQEWLNQDPVLFCTEVMLRNYRRNQQLIDLSFVPSDIFDKVVESYEQQKNKKAKDLMNYFVKNRLKNLTENIGDFV